MTGTHDLSALWQRLEDWLAAHAPGDHASLRDGASAEDVDRLEAELGFALHPGLRTLLARHDGVRPRRASTEPGAFLLNYTLLGVEGVLEGQQRHASMAQDALDDVEEGEEDTVIGTIVHSLWVPFAESFTGDALFVDHRPGPHYGEIGDTSFGAPSYTLLWPGQEAMLDDLCTAVETGAASASAGRVPHVHEGRMLQWV